MGFQHIKPLYIEGSRMLGLSLDALHAKEPSLEDLKEWAYAFSEKICFVSSDAAEYFQHNFTQDLEFLCVYVASSDGDVSGNEIARINSLLNTSYNHEDIDSIADFLRKANWAETIPVSFQMLIAAFGNANSNTWEATQSGGEVARFYYQVAKYIHAADNANPYDKDAPSYEFIEALPVYVERVSATDFVLPENEDTIEEIRLAHAQLVESEIAESRSVICGSWKAIRGNVLTLLSGFVLKPDGSGYMTKKRLFGEKREPVTWEITDMGFGHEPLIHIPSLCSSASCTIVNNESMMVMLISQNPKLHGMMAQCVRR